MLDYFKKVVSGWIGRPRTERNKTPRIIEADEHKIDPDLVSYAARRTCEILQSRGYRAYIVGGAVRDLLLGVRPKDFDVATDATPEQVKRCQRRAYIIGRRFRLVHVVFGDEIIECSTFRALDAAGVRKDSAGRVISDNVFGEMWEDAARRDFTINALYYDPASGRIYDYHRGYEDIRKKRLCMIGEPVERYREDPVRMMRAVRIATKLGFAIESATERAIPKMAHTLDNVPAARLFDEMMKLFTCGHAESCLVKLRAEGLHRSLLPMLDVILDEEEGEKFLMLALRRTDERIAVGKKISPAFLFATLLWPQVHKRWTAYQARPKMVRSTALYAAANDVVATQCAKLAIQNRFVADMKLIWMLQLRFERRTGKNPYSLTAHPKYRAGYDFLLLRSLLGHIDPALVRWWEEFVEADAERRTEMIAEQEKAARATGQAARAGNRARRDQARERAEERAEDATFAAIEEERERPRRRSRGGAGRKKSEARGGACDASRFEARESDTAPAAVFEEVKAVDPVQTEPPEADNAEAAPKKPRRRRTKAAVGPQGEPDASAPSAGDSVEAEQEAVGPRKSRSRKLSSEDPSDAKASEAGTEAGASSEMPAPRPKRTRRPKAALTAAPQKSEDAPAASEAVAEKPAAPKRRRLDEKKDETAAAAPADEGSAA